MTTTAGDAVAELGRVLGRTPPEAVGGLDPSVIRRLTDAVVAEQLRQQRALGEATDRALRLVPRPLRGLVKRLITP